MTDPVVHITNGVPDSGTGNITTLGQTLVDGANATMGVTTGAAVTTDTSGTLQQYLRGLVKLWGLGIAAGSALIGKVGIDQTTDGTTNKVAANVRHSDGTVITDATGIKISTSQLAALATTPQTQSAGFQLTDVPTDGTVSTRFGPVTETAPASDTASSGLNGRLQRVAQRLTSLIGLLPGALGSGGGLKVDDIYSAYETVAASQTDQVMGGTGATGDYLAGVLVVPGTSAAGAVSIKDGSGSAISVFAGGGTTALADLKPFLVPLGLYSTGGAWKITTGANVTAIGIGKFT